MADFHEGKLLRIFVDQHDRWHGQPLYTAIVGALKRAGIAGATVFMGIEGFGSHKQVHVSSVFGFPNLPVLIEVVDEPEKIVAVVPQLRSMISEGLVTLERVEFAVFAPAKKR